LANDLWRAVLKPAEILREVSILCLSAHKRLLDDGDVPNAWSAYLLADQAAALGKSAARASNDGIAPVNMAHSPEIGSLLQHLQHDREDTVDEARSIAFEAIGDVLPKNGGILARLKPEFQSEEERLVRFNDFMRHMCEYSFDNLFAALDYLESVVDG
jgi:hypothetical protein